MNPEMQALYDALEKSFSGTLADFKKSAALEMNGTEVRWVKDGDGVRWLIAVCITGEYEINRIAKAFPAANITRRAFADTGLMETVLAAIFSKAVIFCEERDEKNNLTALVLISAVPRSVENVFLERLFNLPA